jgi:GNAT superfamily N-acetyltransferase
MDPVIRSARPDDVPGIVSWTADTFEWGDYVAEALPGWLDDPSGSVVVADVHGTVVALGRVAMVSATEAWAQGARVHPDHRRRGLGTAISEGLWEWARDHGARVVRLTVEDDNGPARAQVTSMGFRRTGDWRFGTRAMGDRSPVPEGNGGQRVPAAERLQPAHSSEAEPAFLSWLGGELSHAAGGLIHRGWVWRLMTPDDLAAAARHRDLWEGRPGWVIATEDERSMRVDWVETSNEDAKAMMRALIDRGVEAGARTIDIMVPAVPWLERAARRASFDLRGLGVYALPL